MFSKFRLVSAGFIGISLLGVMIIETAEKLIGAILIGVGLIPATLFLLKAKAEEA